MRWGGGYQALDLGVLGLFRLVHCGQPLHPLVGDADGANLVLRRALDQVVVVDAGQH